MKDLIIRLLPPNLFTNLNIWSLKQNILLFDSREAANEIAFMLGGEWDGCNCVVVDKCDEVAVNTAANLLGAQWCYSGSTFAFLVRLPVAELKERYVVGERNFVNANLRCALLNDLNLSAVNLSYAKLNKANLSKTNLSGSDLTAADLSDANLSGADLRGANLSRADLRGANLSQANLNNANLRGTKLNKADLLLATMNSSAST